MIRLLSYLFGAVLCVAVCCVQAQSEAGIESASISSGDRKAIVAKIGEIFSVYYPLPQVADEMVTYLEGNLAAGDYEQYSTLGEFTSRLTEDMRAKSDDYHIKIMPYEELPADLAVEKRLGRPYDNYGFQKVEILPGNIGYFNLTVFNNPETAGATAVACMNFLANCDALIIDLRLNGGGDEVLAPFLSSYFFSEAKHLNDMYVRKDGTMDEEWSLSWVPGPRMTDIPVYILQSGLTYSAAEHFGYCLQQIGRAKIVGEKTRGGAYAVTYKSYPDIKINMKVPYTNDVNPYSKESYAGGVIPDIETSERNALAVAYLDAAKKLLETETDESKRYRLNWIITDNMAKLNPLEIDQSTLTEYEGVYKNVVISAECGKLYLKRGDWARQEMAPMGDDVFGFADERESKFRVRFVRDEAGAIVEMQDFDSDGDSYPPKRKESKP